MKNSLNKVLNQLNLIENNAVFFRNKEDGATFDDFSADINKKLDTIKPDAFFVFNKQPLVLFFDLTSENIGKKNENEIHKQVWSFDNSPVIFIIKDYEIKVYNALNFVKTSLEEIELSEEERNKQFSFWNLQSGTTWKWLQEDYYVNNKKKENRKRVNEKLFENIKNVRETLVNKNNIDCLKDDEANSLILRLIFIRYLIDRNIKIDTNFISGNSKIERRLSFTKLILDPIKLNGLFFKLNTNFNGVLFKELDFQISENQSKYLAQVFKGEIEEPGSLFEGFYFEIFDFSIIPVEVISGIYESLIDPVTAKLDSAVYTPSFLVDYILKDTVDQYLENNNTSECKIFEVAVGSGIFLVQSLRKMIEKDIEINGKSNKKLFSERIRIIAKDNLFGIDTNLEALKVTCFSIYIALLDYQDPKDIDIYKFPNLINENLFEANFFDVNHDFNEIIKSKKTQFILGNPPWKSKKADTLHTAWLKENKKTVGNFEIAQSFLLRSKDFMQPHTKTALIVTSTMFYNVSKTSRAFKNEFLTSFCVDKFFDLSAVKQSLFEKQESPTSILFYRLSKNNDYLNNVVNHQSLKVNSFLKNFKMLVIEKFDQKQILQKHFIENDWMFKVALYGNTLDFVFIKRILSLDSKKLGSFVDNKLLYATSGILKGNQKNSFDFLEGLPIIQNEEVNLYYTKSSEENFYKFGTKIEAGRKIENFNTSKILIKEQAKDWSDLVISYNENASIYKKGVFGLTCENDILLKKIYSNLISELYTYYIFSISGGWGIATHPQVKWKNEYLSFPIIETDELTNNKLVGLVEDFITPLKKHYNEILKSESLPINYNVLKEINKIVNDLYEIKSYEKDLIDYVLNVSRYQFQESKQHLVSNFSSGVREKNQVLKNYAAVYIQEFEKIYDDEFFKVEVYDLGHFITMHFILLDEKPKKQFEIIKEINNDKKLFEKLSTLSISKIANNNDNEFNLFIQKDIKGFEENSFYIIKPNEYKCWHRAMAWYDVAEFREAIQRAELVRMNQSDIDE